MQQAIDELGEKCRQLRDEYKRTEAENNYFHMSTAIFLKMQPVNETEKKLCHELAELNLEVNSDTFHARREKIEKGLTKCKETYRVMDVKLMKVLNRLKKSERESRSPEKKRRAHHITPNS